MLYNEWQSSETLRHQKFMEKLIGEKMKIEQGEEGWIGGSFESSQYVRACDLNSQKFGPQPV
jgi:hypothetical protein